MTLKLYELTEQYAALLAAVDAEEDGAFDTALAQLEDEIAVKVAGTALVVRQLEAEESMFVAEVKRLEDRAYARHSASRRLKDYLRDQMLQAGLQRVTEGIVDVRLQDSPPSVEVYDDAALGAEWKRATLRMPLAQVPEELLGMATVEVDRRGILEWHRQGHDLPDGVALTRSQHIRIR